MTVHEHQDRTTCDLRALQKTQKCDMRYAYEIAKHNLALAFVELARTARKHAKTMPLLTKSVMDWPHTGDK